MFRATLPTYPALPRRVGALLALPSLFLGAVACTAPGADKDSQGPLRLVDLFPQATVEGTPAALEAPPPVKWSFDVAEDAAAWSAPFGVVGFSSADGALRGTSGAPMAVLAVDFLPSDPSDSIYAVEVRLRVSRPTNLLATFDSSEAVNLPALMNPFSWAMRTPALQGDAQTYELRPTTALRLEGTKRLLLRPAEEPGVEFAVESVRVITRKAHLLAVPPGIGWQGAREIYREAIASRAPERVRYTLDLPSRPRLDLALATLEPGAGTFTVEVSSPGRDSLAVSRTVSEQLAWQPFSLDLERFGGTRVELTLALSGPHDGFLGLWGTPVVRQIAAASQAERPRGVILVIADTLRRDHLDLYGYERDTAPNIARLASEGGKALDALSQATWTKVSVPAIQTGLYPSTHSVVDLPDLLPATATTLAEVFREAGYATIGFASIPFVGRFTNLHQGYEEFHEPSSLQASQNNKSAREYMGRLLPWLERHRDVPFFALLHVADPHSPYFAHEPYDELWGAPGDADAHRAALEQVRPHIAHPLMKNFGMPMRSELVAAGVDAEQFVDRELDAYDGSIRGLDVEIGRLIEQLDYLGLRDDVLIGFVSDHGTEFLDHDAHFHGHSAYGELNRVPLFFWGPRFVPAGIEIPGTVQTIDLAPTLLELARLERPAAMQGRSLAPYLRAGAPAPEPLPAFTEKAIITGAGGVLPGRDFTSYAVVSDGWKLIWNHEAPRGIAEYELFDHAADPLNLRDVAAEHQDQVSRLRAVIEEWREAALAARLDPASTEGMSAEELERLRALGYVQ